MSLTHRHTQSSMAVCITHLVALSSLVLLMWEPALAGTAYVVINNAANEAGGQKFEQVVGSSGAEAILASASEFIQQTFGYAGNPSYPQKPVEKVTLYVDDKSGGAVAIAQADTSGAANAHEIHLSQSYVGTYSGDVATEIKGVLYHEMTHVWQWNGQGRADGGLIEGIADYVRLTAGLAPSHWVKPGQGDRWNQGYDVTAYFLQYCDSLQSGFVAALNAKLASGWDVSYFEDLLGRSVDELWASYKEKYGM
ncbi:hypothetical protein L7F22_025099 [Adiantum nelumboides]|nr:hypothetical protein [Adiantum nelumboides]